MIDVVYENLSKRQRAYREVCKRFDIEIGDEGTSAGEDAALYFNVLNDEAVECAPERDVMRYCAITVNVEHGIHYAYGDFNTLAEAKARAVENIDDSVYAEYPVEIVNLDTGRRYRVAELVVRWEAV